MQRKLFFIRELSPNISSNIDVNFLTDFKKVNGIDRFGYGDDDGFKEYRVRGDGWPVYVFFGTEEDLKKRLDSRGGHSAEGGYTICTEIPPQYLSKKVEGPSRRVHLRINEVDGLMQYTLDAQVELGEAGLFIPEGELTDKHDPHLKERVLGNEGYYGECVVYDPGKILSFDKLPHTLIFTKHNKETELIREIIGVVLSDKELNEVNDEVESEIHKINEIFYSISEDEEARKGPTSEEWAELEKKLKERKERMEGRVLRTVDDGSIVGSRGKE